MRESKKVKVRRLNNFTKRIEEYDIVTHMIMTGLKNRLLGLGVIKHQSFKKPRIAKL